jgi:hypothetical protein
VALRCMRSSEKVLTEREYPRQVSRAKPAKFAKLKIKFISVVAAGAFARFEDDPSIERDDRLGAEGEFDG